MDRSALESLIWQEVFEKLGNREIPIGLQKSRFKQMIEGQLEQLYKGTNIKFKSEFEGDKLIVMPYTETMAFTITLDK